MQQKICLSLIVASVLGGCASTPQNIEPAFIHETAYQGWSCDRVAAERVRVTSDLATASAAQRHTRTIDTVGVALMGLPVGSLFGGRHDRDIAWLKGQQIAIERHAVAENCAAGLADATPTQPR